MRESDGVEGEREWWRGGGGGSREGNHACDVTQGISPEHYFVSYCISLPIEFLDASITSDNLKGTPLH